MPINWALSCFPYLGRGEGPNQTSKLTRLRRIDTEPT